MDVSNDKLSPQREVFAIAIAGGASQADAYRKAYPRSKSWKPESVYSKSSQLMTDAKVAARVTELRAAIASKAVLSASEVLNEIRKLTLSDVSLLVGKNGRMLPPHKLPAEIRACIASVKKDKSGNWEYRLWDKNAATEKASRILGLYEKDNKQRADALGELLNGLSGNVKGVVLTPEPDDNDA